jgi:hypothetical protein
MTTQNQAPINIPTNTPVILEARETEDGTLYDFSIPAPSKIRKELRFERDFVEKVVAATAYDTAPESSLADYETKMVELYGEATANKLILMFVALSRRGNKYALMKGISPTVDLTVKKVKGEVGFDVDFFFKLLRRHRARLSVSLTIIAKDRAAVGEAFAVLPGNLWAVGVPNGVSALPPLLFAKWSYQLFYCSLCRSADLDRKKAEETRSGVIDLNLAKARQFLQIQTQSATNLYAEFTDDGAEPSITTYLVCLERFEIYLETQSLYHPIVRHRDRDVRALIRKRGYEASKEDVRTYEDEVRNSRRAARDRVLNLQKKVDEIAAESARPVIEEMGLKIIVNAMNEADPELGLEMRKARAIIEEHKKKALDEEALRKRTEAQELVRSMGGVVPSDRVLDANRQAFAMGSPIFTERT